MKNDLRTQRNGLRLSQSALSRLAGVSRVHICWHELGGRRLTPDEAVLVESAMRREAQRLRRAADSIANEVNVA